MNEIDQHIDEEIEIEDTEASGNESEEIIDPVMNEPFNPAEINIVSKPDTLHNIIERLKHDEINMITDFQRHAELWPNPKMSRLIESILIRFPLPAFYFDASDDDHWLIVDGLQRLSSIKKFVVDGKLRLHGLEYLTDFNGFKYDDLPRTYKRRIDECPVTLFLIQPGTPEKVKYSIFRRINTGGLVLNDQEIRNAMTTSENREFLKNLSLDPFLIKVIGDQSRRMLDQEWVLRYLAFQFMDFGQSRKNITTFLDEMLAELEKANPADLDKYGQSFHRATKRCWEVFGIHAFEKSTDGNHAIRRRKNSTLFEVWMVALSKLSDNEMNKLIEKKDDLVQEHLNLMAEDNDYFRSITYSTQKKDHFRIRHNKARQLIEEVLRD